VTEQSPPWRTLAAFLLGLTVGMAAMAPVAGRSVERLRTERDSASNRAAALEKEVGALQESLRKRQAAECYVRTARVHVGHEDLAVLLEAERLLQRDLSRYVGRPLRAVEPFDLLRRFDRRQITVEGVTYLARLVQAVVAEEMALYFELERVSRKE
jgi:hypothetical protein